MAKLRTASGLIDVTPYFRTSSGLTEITAPMFRNASNTLVQVGQSAAPMSVTITPASASGAAAQNRPVDVYTNTLIAKVTGGVEPYASSWISDNPQVAVVNGNISGAYFRARVSPGDYVSAGITLTVTDAKGSTVEATTTADLYNDGGSGGIIP